jgi:large subunit ribosomal protein L6
MSNIGRRVIQIPKGTVLSFDENERILKVEGQLDTFYHKIDQQINIFFEDSKLKIESLNKALQGTQNALITNLIEGATKGFKVTLKLVGIGFRASLTGKLLTLKLGYSHDIQFEIPTGIYVSCPKVDTIILFATDKMFLTQVATKIRDFRKPDSYKGKGIIFEGQQISLKEGKKK